MVVNEQEPAVSEEAKEETEQPQAKLGTLTAVEQIVNLYAKGIAEKYRVKPEQFQIHLVTKFKGVMGLKRGPVVQIFLLWPDAQPNMNTLLRSAFQTISRHKLIDPLNIESVAHIRARNLEQKKWLRENYGDEAEILHDLIPRSRIVVSTKTVTTYKDTVTGMTVEVASETKEERYERHDVKGWLELSRKVRDAMSEQAE